MLNEFAKYFSQMNKNFVPSFSSNMGLASGLMAGDGDDPKPKPQTYKTQAEVDAANAEARAFAKRHNMVIANDAYVAKKPGDPIVPYTTPDGKQYTPPQMPQSMIKPLPDWVTQLEWNPDWQMPYYKDGNDIVYVDRSHYNSPRFLKSRQQQEQAIAMRK